MSAVLIGAGTAVAGLGLSAYESAHQAHKANEIQKNLHDPVYNIPPEFEQNREIARQMAEIGMPQQQYNNRVNNINQTQAAGLASLSKSANPGAGVTSVVRQGNQAKATLDAEDEQARVNNQRYFINENTQLGNQEEKKQQSDVFDKFTRDFNTMQAYRGASQQNLNNAISGATQLGETALNYKANNPSSPNVTSTLPPGTAQQMQIPEQYWPGAPPQGKTPYQYPGMFQPWDGTDQSQYKPLI